MFSVIPFSEGGAQMAFSPFLQENIWRYSVADASHLASSQPTFLPAVVASRRCRLAEPCLSCISFASLLPRAFWDSTVVLCQPGGSGSYGELLPVPPPGGQSPPCISCNSSDAAHSHDQLHRGPWGGLSPLSCFVLPCPLLISWGYFPK